MNVSGLRMDGVDRIWMDWMDWIEMDWMDRIEMDWIDEAKMYYSIGKIHNLSSLFLFTANPTSSVKQCILE